MIKQLIPSIPLLFAYASTAQAAVVTWGGAGTEATPEFWNVAGSGTGQNGDPTHWGQAAPPDMTGLDQAIINGGGIQKNASIDFQGGSVMTLNSGAYFVLNPTINNFTITTGAGLQINSGTFEATVNSLTVAGAGSFLNVQNGLLRFNDNASSGLGFGLNGGATATVGLGGTIEISTFFNSQNQNVPVGGTFVLDGGTLLVSAAQSNPLRAANGLDGGGFDFTGLGGTIELASYSGSGTVGTYFDSKLAPGFFKIDGTVVSGFGQANAINGEWLELTDNGSSGMLVLVPEPSCALLLLGTLGVGLTRRVRRA